MKNLLKVLLFVMILCVITEANAQTKVGGGVFYASKLENVGISVNGNYFFSDNFSAAPSFTYFFEKDNLNWSMLDLDVNYHFAELDFATVYGVGGLNVTFVEVLGYTGSNTGLNLGLGLAMPLSDAMTLCPEIKYTLGDGDFFRIGLKLLFEI